MGLLLGTSIRTDAQQRVCPIFFWNVENFFDCSNDSLTLDDEYTPEGDLHWTPRRYAAKRNILAKTILSIGDYCHGEMPAIMGLCEIENDQVLRDLTLGTPLRHSGYEFIHYDSPDRRGVDCALLYRRERFAPLSSEAIYVGDSANGFFTRDILRVTGILDGRDTIHLFVCHLPSKRGGDAAEHRRENISILLGDSIRALQIRHPKSYIVAMGDMNCEAHEIIFSSNPSEMGFTNLASYRGNRCDDSLSKAHLQVVPERTDVAGSYFYQGAWSTIDQMMISPNLVAKRLSFGHRLKLEGGFFVFAPDWLLEPVPHLLSSKPLRTYQGPRYRGGASDHLPVGIILK